MWFLERTEALQVYELRRIAVSVISAGESPMVQRIGRDGAMRAATTMQIRPRVSLPISLSVHGLEAGWWA